MAERITIETIDEKEIEYRMLQAVAEYFNHRAFFNAVLDPVLLGDTIDSFIRAKNNDSILVRMKRVKELAHDLRQAQIALEDVLNRELDDNAG